MNTINEYPKPTVETIENPECRIARVIPFANPNVYIEIRQYKSYYSFIGWSQPTFTMPEVAIENIEQMEQFQAAIKVAKKLYKNMSTSGFTF